MRRMSYDRVSLMMFAVLVFTLLLVAGNNVGLADQNNTGLSSLIVSTGDLDPVFSSSNTAYAVNLNNDVGEIQFTPTANDSSAEIKVNGVIVQSGKPTDQIEIDTGTNIISIVVTLFDASTTYTINVKREGSAELQSLIVNNGGAFAPDFSSDITDYTVLVGNSVSFIQVTPTANDSSATILVNNSPVSSGKISTAISLNYGDNSVSIAVSAPGNIRKTYNLLVKRAFSTVETLRLLSPSTSTLYPLFKTNITEYTIGLDYSKTSVSLTVAASEAHATITVNGVAPDINGKSQAISLSPGENPISVVVTAQDGSTQKTYTVKAYRMAETWQKVGDLSNVLGNAIDTCMDAGKLYFVTNYLVYKYDGVKWVQVGPAFGDNRNSMVRLSVYDGTPYVVYYSASSQQMNILKFNGTSWETIGEPFPGTGESVLSITEGGAFLAYLKQDENNSGIKKLAVKEFQDGKWADFGGSQVSAGSASNIDMCVSDRTVFVAYKDLTQSNKLTVKKCDGTDWTILGSEGFSSVLLEKPAICAYNGVPYVAYLVNTGNVNTERISIIKFRDGLWESVGGDSVAMGMAYGRVTLDVEDGNAYIAFADRNKDDRATVLRFNGSTWVPLGEPDQMQVVSSALSLFVDHGVPYLTHDGEAGSRPAIIKFQPNASAYLTGIDVVGGTFRTAFEPDTLTYTVDVAGTTATAVITPVAEDINADIEINGHKVASGVAFNPIPLNFGDNTISINVTSQDGNSLKTYTLTMYRPYCLYMTGIELSSGYLEPRFDVLRTNYTINLAPTVTSLKMKPVFSDEAASVKVNGQIVANGASFTKVLAGGKNIISLVVESADHLNTTAYTFTVYRQSGVWKNVGSAVTQKVTFCASPAFVFNNSQPYVAYCSDRVYVSYFNGSSWIRLPQVNGLNNKVDDLSMSAYNGTPYVAYSGGSFRGPSVEKYYNSQWKYIVPGYLITQDNGRKVSIGIYKGTPYVAYINGVNEGTVSVKKFNGKAWLVVGSGYACSTIVKSLAFCIDQSTGTPYIAYIDNATKKVGVSKFSGSAWVTVGGTVPVGESGKVILSVYNNIPYIACAGGVYKLSGVTWLSLGGAGVMAGEAIKDLAVYGGVPYCLFDDVGNNNLTTLRKYTGSGWENVGVASIMGGERLQIYNGTPYIVYLSGSPMTGESIYVTKYTLLSNANLSSLSVKVGTKSYALAPSFTSATTSYTVNVPYTISSVTIGAVRQDVTAAVTGAGTITLAYGTNVKVVKVTSGNGLSTKTYTLKIIRALPPKPSVNSVSLTPTGAYGFTLGGTNRLQINAVVKTTVNATVKAYVYNAAGKWVAAITLLNQGSGTKVFQWDGRATSGNTANITVGAYAPSSVGGVKCTIKICVSNPGGTIYSGSVTTILYSTLVVSKFAVSPISFAVAGTNKAKISYQINHMSNVEIRIVDSLGHIIAKYKYFNVRPNYLQSAYWDGKATSDNTAGYLTGSAAPPGRYNIVIQAGGTIYSPTTAITIFVQ